MRTPKQSIEHYVTGAMSGSILANKWQRLAVERYLRDCENSGTDGFPYYFDEEELEDVVNFLRLLKHYKGPTAGQHFEPEPWQVFVIGNIFCWKNQDTHLRRFNLAYVAVPRKNGKTFLAAGTGLYLFAADGEGGAEIYTAATKLDQAKLAHKDAKQMVINSPALSKHALVQKELISIEKTASIYKPLGRDASSLDGLNVHGAIIDEFHAHKSDELFSVIYDATGAREQPLMFIITTAGFLLEGPCRQRQKVCEDILEGNVIDERQFAFICCADDGDDWKSPETWQKANPNYGVSLNPDDIQRAATDAENVPNLLNNFLTKRLNMWVGQDERWLDMDLYAVCAEQEPKPLDDRRVYGGMDLSSTSDLTAWAWLAYDPDDDMYDLHVRIWVPGETARKKGKKDGVPYEAWEREGWVTMTDGNAIDYAYIKARVLEDIETMGLDVAGVGGDPWNATQITTELMDEGVPMVKVRQGFMSMNDPCKQFEKLMNEGRLRIGRNPVLRWMAGNIATDTDPAGNIKPAKNKSGNKIDGLVASIMAVGLAISEDEGPSRYESDGIFFI